MCAIAGIVSVKPLTETNQLVQRLLNAVAHRGPDGQGVFHEPNIWLGHRRLSIVDLSDAAAQPMRSMCENLIITYNGEIYNHIELRLELQKLGHRFHSQSDTEVILAAFLQWGESCVSRFNGMWAFAIWDRRTQSLFCSRDRFGVKPFYFLPLDGGFVFGSEIRQLLPWINKRCADKSLMYDFILSGATDHTDRTFFDQIEKLPASHNMTWSAKSGTRHLNRYYRLERKLELYKLPDQEAIHLYGRMLEDAVRLRLRSDVPVGTCLSGGLDSSSIAMISASIYSGKTDQRFAAITAVSEQADNSEEHFAKLVVDAANLEWHTVCPSYDDMCSNLAAVVRAQEEPFGSASIIMQYAVMQKARATSIPVLLDGQGGDETLLGYPKYVSAFIATQWVRGGMNGLVSSLNAALGNNTSWSLWNMMAYLTGSRFGGLRHSYYAFQNSYLKRVPKVSQHIQQYAACCFDDFELQRLEIERTNLPALLRYEDKNSMVHSVETRLPFLDYRLVEFALSINSSLKIRDGWSKWLLRKSMSTVLPQRVAWRRDKLGFEAPERTWQLRLQADMLMTIAKSSLLADMGNLNKLKRSFPSLPLRTQWRLFSVALWEKEFNLSGWTSSDPH
jgi:asparagine synthase (glutamine-hydrolysing)